MLRTLIVDDEAPARARLRRLLRSFEDGGRVSIVAEASDGVEALEYLREDGVDLLLLDIQMPGLSGFDVLDRLPPEGRPVVVFVTAYDRYALQAFEAAAVDYLLKPVAEERLAEAVERAARSTARPEREAHMTRLADLLDFLDGRAPARTENGSDYLRQLSIPIGERFTVVPVERLVAAEVEDGLTRLYVLPPPGEPQAQAVRHTVTSTLDALERRLDPAAFMRVHRSSIVQLAHIREMAPWFSGRYKLVLAGGHETVASRARSKELREHLSL